MIKELTQKEYWELFQKLPDELKTQTLSEETAKNIFDICQRNDVNVEEISKVASYVGQVLLGILPPDEFQEAIEKEVKLEKEIAKKVAQEIYRFVFYPVKSSLEELYKIEIAPLAKMKITPPPQEKPPTPPKKEDVYREPVK
ncbi:MAG: hypothetical protein IB617_00925 [Candidatus Nealsonbacteria bacterium]|nr:MAG: hypothetical protein IB617_00925 [Candidatus Nealsonbacteria bacterium]